MSGPLPAIVFVSDAVRRLPDEFILLSRRLSKLALRGNKLHSDREFGILGCLSR